MQKCVHWEKRSRCVQLVTTDMLKVSETGKANKRLERELKEINMSAMVNFSSMVLR